MPLAPRGKDVSEKAYRQAELLGVRHRQIGKKRSDNPYTGKPSQRVLADGWDSGWMSQDLINRGNRNGNRP